MRPRQKWRSVEKKELREGKRKLLIYADIDPAPAGWRLQDQLPPRHQIASFDTLGFGVRQAARSAFLQEEGIRLRNSFLPATGHNAGLVRHNDYCRPVLPPPPPPPSRQSGRPCRRSGLPVRVRLPSEPTSQSCHLRS